MDTKETIVKEIWKEVFGAEHLDLENDFFDLGGDSILAVQLSGKLRKKGYRVKFTDIFDDSTLGGIIRAVSPVTGTEPDGCALSEEQRKTYPATNQQKWFYQNVPCGRNDWCEYVFLKKKEGCDFSFPEAAKQLLEKGLLAQFREKITEEGLFFERQSKKPELIHVSGESLTEETLRKVCEEQISPGDGRTCAILYDDAGGMLLVVHHLFCDVISMQNLLGALDQPDAIRSDSDTDYACYAWEQKEREGDAEPFDLVPEDPTFESKTNVVRHPLEAFSSDRLTKLAKAENVSVESLLLKAFKKPAEKLLEHPVMERERIGRDRSGRWNDAVGWFSFSENLDFSEIPEEDSEGMRAIETRLNEERIDSSEQILRRPKCELVWNYIGRTDRSLQFEHFSVTDFGQYSGVHTGRFAPVYFGVYLEEKHPVCTISYDRNDYTDEQMRSLQERFSEELTRIAEHLENQKTEELNTIYEILGDI